MRYLILTISLLFLAFTSPDADPDLYFEVSTPEGRFVIKLYDETPLHRDNFRGLVEEGFYDGTTFHRIIGGFMIQGGDPNSLDDDPYNDGAGDLGYTVEAEIVPHLIHKRGAIAAARTGDAVNPERRSNGSQFYIVQGQTFTDFMLDQVEQQIRQMTGDVEFAFSDTARAVYREMGGAPNLDRQYTVFGEVVEGMDVVDALAAAPTPRSTGRSTDPQLVDRPLEPIPMTVRLLPDYGE